MASPSTAKYIIKATLKADGVVEKPDIVGAVFGQTEGLLGSDMELRDLQKAARIGRLQVDLEHKGGKTTGTLRLPSHMDKPESAIIGAAIETIDRIGPSKAEIKVVAIEDDRAGRRDLVRERAKELLRMMNDDPTVDTGKIVDDIKSSVQVDEITYYPGTKIPCGPNVQVADSIIIVEGRNDVINLLKCGIRNAIAVEGAKDIKPEIIDLSKEKTTTIFVDGDRGGELIARAILQTCDVDFVARAPDTREVEELPHKLVMKCLKDKRTADQFISQSGINVGERPKKSAQKPAAKKTEEAKGGRGRGRGGAKDEDKKPARGRGAKQDDDEKPARGRGRGRGGNSDEDEKPRGRSPAKKTPKKAAHDPRASVKETLANLSGSLKATILDKDGKAISEDLPVRELADTLKGGKKAIHSVIFDGVITQRLLDIAADKKIATVVGVKMGNVSKVPEDVEILTKDDLQ